jgi:predicted O-methyltransferase YrrM
MITNLPAKIRNRIWKILSQLNTSVHCDFSRVPEEIAAFDKIEGFLRPSEATALFHFASKLKKGATIVEIGSWKGKSTYCLARGLRNGKIFAIDPFDASGEPGSAEIYKKEKGPTELITQFKQRMTDLGVMEKIEILHGYSAEFKDRFETIDLLFIDGDHSIEGCKADFDYFAKAIVRGGYIMFHDYYPERDELGPTWVIKNLIAKNDSFEYVALVESMWIGRRR